MGRRLKFRLHPENTKYILFNRIAVSACIYSIFAPSRIGFCTFVNPPSFPAYPIEVIPCECVLCTSFTTFSYKHTYSHMESMPMAFIWWPHFMESPNRSPYKCLRNPDSIGSKAHRSTYCIESTIESYTRSSAKKSFAPLGLTGFTFNFALSQTANMWCTQFT